MSRAGILLRVVLGLSLMLNGMVGSFAATTMAVQSLAPTPPTARFDRTAATHSGCHQHTPAADSGPQVPATDPGTKLAAGHADCCGVGLCGCACAQLSSLAALDLLFLPAHIGHDRLADAIATSHPAPALPHLIRPPIG